MIPGDSSLATGVERLFIRKEDSIRTVMQHITTAAQAGLPGGIALVVDDAERLIGVVTDGDIRRGLLNDAGLEDSVEAIFTRDPIVFSHRLSFQQILDEIPSRLAQRGRYRGGVMEKVILVDEAGRVEKVLDFVELWRNQRALHRHVAIIGLGYVGLTLAVTLADVGFQVSGVEVNETIRKSLGQGRPHFHEVGLEPLLKHHIKKNLGVVPVPPSDAEIYILSVATPVHNQKPDLEQLRRAAYQIGQVLSYGDLVVLRSTCPVGTCRHEVLPLLEESSGLRCGRDFYLAFAPERTLEGSALSELRSLPQVIGGYDQNAVDMAVSLFREITPNLITVSSLEAAEMVKLVNNSFRDVKFAFANELAMVCERFNLDTVEVVRAANEGYPRDRVPVPSPGVGGACLIKDPYLYAQAADDAGVSDGLSLHGRRINEAMPGRVVANVLRELEKVGKTPATSRFFIAGFAFKGDPETSDMRHSTTLDVLRLLQPVAGEIRGYDPVVPDAALAGLGIEVCALEAGFADADCVIIMNNHRRFAELDIFSALASMRRPAVYCDTWHIFSPEDVKQIGGVTYVGLGFCV